MQTVFQGYRRPDGQYGARNLVAVIPSVICANDVAQAICRQVQGTIGYFHHQGCCQLPLDLRRVTETCASKNKRSVNPIIDWSDDDVWSLLRERRVQCNPLYCDFGRVGCVGCPMAGKAGREREFLRWPRYRRLYLAAFDRMLKERTARGKQTYGWQNAMDVYRWWMTYDELPGQMDILEEDYGDYGAG